MSTSVSIRPELEIAVFAKGTRTNGIPAHRTDRESAVYLESCGLARWVNNRRNSIIMLAERFELVLRGLSCKMDPSVTERAIDGSKYHRALIDGWRGTIANPVPAQGLTDGHGA